MNKDFIKITSASRSQAPALGTRRGTPQLPALYREVIVAEVLRLRNKI